jgi:hypothetical protein
VLNGPEEGHPAQVAQKERRIADRRQQPAQVGDHEDEEDRDVPYHEILEITNQALTVANNEANRQIRTLRGQLEYQNELLADAGYYDEEEGLMDPVHFHFHRRAEFLPDEEKEEVKQEEKQASNISDHTHDHMVVDTEGSEKLSKDLNNMKL